MKSLVLLNLILVLTGSVGFSAPFSLKERAQANLHALQENLNQLTNTLAKKNQSGSCYLLGKIAAGVGEYDNLAGRLITSRHPEIDTTKEYNYTLNEKEGALLIGIYPNMDAPTFCRAPAEEGFGSGVGPADFRGMSATVKTLKQVVDSIIPALNQF